MSIAYWPQEIAQILHERMEFEHPLVAMDRSTIRDYLSEKMKDVPLETFLPNFSAEGT